MSASALAAGFISDLPPPGKHASLDDRVGVEALDGSFLLFCVPHLSHRGWGFQEIGAGGERDTLMPDPRTKGHCILAGPVSSRIRKGSKVQEHLDVGRVVKESTRVTLEFPGVTKSLGIIACN